MDSQEPSPSPAPFWEGHFKLVKVDSINALFDAHGKLFFDPNSQRLRLFDSNGQIRLTASIHRVRQPKSDRFPKGNQYNIQLSCQAQGGAYVDCELQFKSPDEAARLNLHKFILTERGIEHSMKTGILKSADVRGAENAPAQHSPQHQQLTSVANVEGGEGTLEQSNGSISNVKLEAVAEPPRASSPMDTEDHVEQLRQKNAQLEAARRQAEEEISRLNQENAKKDKTIVDLTMELYELKRSK